METRTLLWSLQNTKRFASLPSSYGYGCCVPDEPADEDGWAGYWWAYHVDCMGDIDTSAPLLIRARDVRRALDKQYVDLFLPGLWGTVYATAYTSWLSELDSVPRKYVALYEGEILPEYNIDQLDLFRPIRLVEVLTVREFLNRFAIPVR